MSDAKHITILSGGGSPHGEAYRPVYQLIEEKAATRGFTTHLLDYVGIGHFPEFGMGLNLPGAVEKARKDLKRLSPPTGSTLLCRSFGCDVGAFLFAHHREEMGVFSRIILWGPSSFHLLWTRAERDRGAVDRVNFSSLAKGVQWSPTYWRTAEPIEESVKGFTGIEVDIGYGTNDTYCDAPFAQYLAALITKNTPCPVRVVEIVDAQHEIRADGDARIESEYLEFIFGAASP